MAPDQNVGWLDGPNKLGHLKKTQAKKNNSRGKLRVLAKFEELEVEIQLSSTRISTSMRFLSDITKKPNILR